MAEMDSVITDRFNRQLTYLRLSITDFCNFKCNYCLPNGYVGVDGRKKRAKNEMSLPEITTLLRAFGAVGTKKVRLTGGEPTMRKDLADIISTAKATAGIRTVAMTSNGYRLGKQLSTLSAAGLDQINISVDSFDPHTFAQITGSDQLPQILKDLDSVLESTDIRVKLNGVLMAGTARETLLSALHYVKHRPVTYRFIEFMQTRDNNDVFFAEHANASNIRRYLLERGWRPLVPAANNSDGPAIEYEHADYKGRIGLITPYAPHFCASCNRLRVSSQGKIHLCLFDQKNYDIRPYLQQGDSAGLVAQLQAFMPIKPEHHHLHQANSGIMHNLSLVGG